MVKWPCGMGETLTAVSSESNIGDPEFTSENLQRFVAEKWKNYNCTHCHHREWSADLLQKSVGNIPMSVPPIFTVAGGQVAPVYLIYCNNCGIVNLLSRSYFLSWAQAQRREGQ